MMTSAAKHRKRQKTSFFKYFFYFLFLHLQLSCNYGITDLINNKLFFVKETTEIYREENIWLSRTT